MFPRSLAFEPVIIVTIIIIFVTIVVVVVTITVVVVTIIIVFVTIIIVDVTMIIVFLVISQVGLFISVLEAVALDKSNLPSIFAFPSGSTWDEKRGDTISISTEELESSSTDIGHPKIRIWSSYYRNIDEYLPGKK